VGNCDDGFSPSGTLQMTAKRMSCLREESWQLFDDVTQGERPRFMSWPQRPFETSLLGQEHELLIDLPGEFGGPRHTLSPEVLQSIFFNGAATRHIGSNSLGNKSTAAILLNQARREISEFPKGAVVVKAFWRPLRHGETIKIGIWTWQPHTPGTTQNSCGFRGM
jgi:hypothetical protein